MDALASRPEIASLDDVAAVYLLRSDGAALLQHRDDKPGLRHANMWVPPGGHSDVGETPLACAFREMEEETNYRCAWLKHVATMDDDPGHGWKPFRLHIYVTRFDNRQVIECREGQSLEFIPRARGGELLCPEFVLPTWDLALQALSHQ